ncbi:MAG: DNA polymerase IV [Acidobacteria bacterium]|nr:DNA polymerase IV [Acidobacteriota bacterium]
MHRRILHVDMDAFYASVEQRDNPTLRGRPVAVGGDPTKRGVVAAASYEARAFGVRSALPMSHAVRLCPTLVIVRPDFAKYRAVSREVFDLFRSVTPLVEGLSLDEAYLDVTENAWREPLGVNVARRLKAAIRDATGLTASAGVAPNKFLAKVASGWHKPDGLTVIAPDRVEAFLQNLSVDALWGVGPKTAKKLREHGIGRLLDVRARTRDELHPLVGGMFARTVVIKVRYHDFRTVTRSHSDPQPTRDAERIVARALGLLDKTDIATTSVRLLGVSVHNLSESMERVSKPRVLRESEPRLPFD